MQAQAPRRLSTRRVGSTKAEPEMRTSRFVSSPAQFRMEMRWAGVGVGSSIPAIFTWHSTFCGAAGNEYSKMLRVKIISRQENKVSDGAKD